MTLHSQTQHSQTQHSQTQEPQLNARSTSRVGPIAGIAAGLIGAVATMMSSTPVDLADRRADPAAAATAAFDGLATTLKLSSFLGFLAAGCVVVFVASLRRHLAEQEPGSSLVPAIAWSGGLIAAAALTVAFTSAAIAGTLIDESYRDTTLEVFSAITNNAAFAAWVPLTLTMGALAHGGLRSGSTSRLVGGISAVAGAVLVAALAVGLPFASWAVSCVWLIAVGIGTMGRPGTKV